MRSRPMQELAYSPGGASGVDSVAPSPVTSTNGYTHPVENATMRDSPNVSATSPGR